jgi:hypothetical protein
MTPPNWKPAPNAFIHTFTVGECQALIDTVTPDTNFRVSSARKKHVKKIAADLTNGTYDWSDADPIRLDTFTSGPSNGLHRLRAAVLADKPLPALVLVGPEWRAGYHTDAGRPRAIHEVLSSIGIINGAKKSSLANFVEARRLGREHDMSRLLARGSLVTQDIVVEFVQKHDDLLQEYMNPRVPATFGVSPSVWHGSLVELHLSGWARAARLLQAAPVEYETMQPNDPFQKLLTACMRAKMGSAGTSVQVDVLSSGIRKALEFWNAGEYPDIWRWPRDAADRSCDWLLEPVDPTIADA